MLAEERPSEPLLRIPEWRQRRAVESVNEYSATLNTSTVTHRTWELKLGQVSRAFSGKSFDVLASPGSNVFDKREK
jgi:hypothetical protein